MATETELKQVTDWLKTLLEYATGERTWDTGGVWVCEVHRFSPWETGLPFDCKCGGPGMPPVTPES